MFELPTDSTDGDATANQVTASEWHDLLAVEPRRVALEVLADRTGPVALAELAEAVVAAEEGTDPADRTLVERREIAFHHTHLPKMNDCDVVDYDRERKLIRQ